MLRKYLQIRGVSSLTEKVEKLTTLKYIRSSGPGGQNVNKVSTCAEARLNIYSLHFMNKDAIDRLRVANRNRVNKMGELVVTAQEQRTQIENREIVIRKIVRICEEAMIEPKEKVVWANVSPKGKIERRNFKHHRASKKANRAPV